MAILPNSAGALHLADYQLYLIKALIDGVCMLEAILSIIIIQGCVC